MVEILDIDDVTEHTKPPWSSIITVELKQQPGVSSSGGRYQRFDFVDSKGAMVQGVVFGDDIDLLSHRIKVFSKYKISNAKVKLIPEVYRNRNKPGITRQWILNARTPIMEIPEEPKINTDGYSYVAFDELPKFMDIKNNLVDILAVAIDVEPIKRVVKNGVEGDILTFCILDQNMKTVRFSMWDGFPAEQGKVVKDDLRNLPIILGHDLNVTYFNGITVNSRFHSIILVNPQVKEALELREWVQRNRKEIQDLVRTGGYQAHTPELKIDVPRDITPVANIDSSQKVILANVKFNIKDSTQTCWYMGCTKCHVSTLFPYEEEFICSNIKCGEKQKAFPRCKLEIDLIDDSGIISATLFGEFAEKALQMTAIDVMNSTSEALENHMRELQSQFDEKKFVVKLKPATKLKRIDSNQTYVVMWFSESIRNVPALDSVTVNLQKKFNEAAKDDIVTNKGSKRSSNETMDSGGESNKEANLEIPKKFRSRKAEMKKTDMS